jgi:hypothetical protein
MALGVEGHEPACHNRQLCGLSTDRTQRRRSKTSVVQKRKACTTVSANLALQNDWKNILLISDAFQLFISKKSGGRNLHCNIS